MRNKQWYGVWLSDGSYKLTGWILDEIFISNKLQQGSIVQLTEFQSNKRGILCFNLNALYCKGGIIGNPKRLRDNETPLVERATPTIQDHANSHHVEEPPTTTQKQDHIEEPPTSTQNPSTSTQKCSSHSPTDQNKKRKFQSSDDAISIFGTDNSDVMKMIVEKTIEDGLGPCYKKLGTLEEDVSLITRMMIEKNKEDDFGSCHKKLDILAKDVSRMARTMIEKNKQVDVGFKKLETVEQDVSKLMRLTMEKNKQDDVGACFNKLETLEEDVSKLTRMTIEKNKDDDVGACFKKLETLEQDVSRMTRMIMEKNKEDDMGACIDKLDKMGWGAEEPIFDTALLLFLKGADYRKLWLHLKAECCEKWVKIAGSISGLLD